MKLKFDPKKINYWAERYGYPLNEDSVLDLTPIIQKQRYITKDQLETICKWKSPRSAGNMLSNDSEFVKEITTFTFKTENERGRIESLTLLDGVGWPSASVMLHLYHPDPYPLLDFRALWSIGVETVPNYKYEFWWDYVCFCRKLSINTNVSMRTLDKALWQYSKENQL